MIHSWRDPYGYDCGLFARGCVHKKGGGSAPAAPDPAATAAAQAAANKETAIAQAGLNMVNQTDPYGNKLIYNQIGTWSDGTPRYEALQSLSPETQALYDKTQNIYGEGLNTAGNLLGNVQSQLSNPASQYSDSYQQDIYDKMLQRSQGERDRQRAALETQLANQGIGIGSQAYTDAFDVFNKGQNDYLLGADLQSQQAAMNRLQAEYGGRSQTLNELNALLGTGQVSSPSFGSTPQTGVANTDVIGPTALAYQGQLANWQNSQANRQSTMGALAGLGGSALGGWASAGFPALAFSDERLKENIEEAGTVTVETEVPVYTYNYKWESPEHRRAGVMAQELEKVKPDAVHTHPSGYKMVDYSRI